jgi:hypothetical protein
MGAHGRARLSRHAETARAIDYMLTRLPAFTRFLDRPGLALAVVEIAKPA